MGVCCDKSAESEVGTNPAGRPKREPAISISSDDPGLSSVDAVMTRQRKMSTAQRQAQADHVLSFKQYTSFKQVERFQDLYSVKKELGAGAFGSVKLGKHRKADTPVAIKFIKKSSLMVADVYQELMKNELEVLENTIHPNITRVYELMEDKRNYYIIMELISGGNLLDQVYKLKKFSEQQAARIIKQLLLALNYRHAKNITHRDLKPENLLTELSDDGEILIKLTDFGFATYFKGDEKLTLSLGSPLYMAPELCEEREYDNRVDVWSTGVITYILLSGMPPFSGQTKEQIYDRISRADPRYDRLGGVSDEGVRFIQRCLTKDFNDRATIPELLEDPWIATHATGEALASERMLDISANLASFRKTTTFQSGVISFISHMQTSSSQLTELKEMFKTLDKNNDGSISLEELEEGMSDIVALFNLDEPDVREMLAAADADKNGTIDYGEFIAAAFDRDILLSQKNLEIAFKIFDTDGNGVITKEELKGVFGNGTG